jgi:hypothetical protein
MITEGGIMSRWKLEREPAAPSSDLWRAVAKLWQNYRVPSVLIGVSSDSDSSVRD